MEENKVLIQNINADLLSMMNSSFVMNTVNNGNYTSNDSSYTFDMFIELSLGMIESIEHIIGVITDKKKTIYLWQILRQQYSYIYSIYRRASYKYRQRSRWLDAIANIDNQLYRLDPYYHAPSLKSNNNSAKTTILSIAFIIVFTIVIVLYFYLTNL